MGTYVKPAGAVECSGALLCSANAISTVSAVGVLATFKVAFAAVRERAVVLRPPLPLTDCLHTNRQHQQAPYPTSHDQRLALP